MLLRNLVEKTRAEEAAGTEDVFAGFAEEAEPECSRGVQLVVSENLSLQLPKEFSGSGMQKQHRSSVFSFTSTAKVLPARERKPFGFQAGRLS